MGKIIGAKKPFELFKLVENMHTSTGVWACGECGIIYQQQERATNCCEAPFCKECKKQYTEDSYYTLCPDCLKKSSELKEQAKWDKMPLVEYENGPVVDDAGDYDGEEFELKNLDSCAGCTFLERVTPNVFELKTIAFEFETMKRLIGYGEPIVTDGIFIGFDKEANPSNLSMGIWLEFVPQAFKSIAQRAIQDLHAKFMFTYANEETRIAVIQHMLHFIRADMLETEALERSKLKNNYPW